MIFEYKYSIFFKDECEKNESPALRECTSIEKVFSSLNRSDYYCNYHSDHALGLIYADEALRVLKKEFGDMIIVNPDYARYASSQERKFAHINVNSLLSLALAKKALCWKNLKRDYHQVIKLFEKSVYYDSSRYEAYNQLALIYMSLQDWKKAIDYLDIVCMRVMDLDMDEELKVLKYHCLCNKSIALSGLNLLEESIQCLTEAIKLLPNATTAYEYLLNIEYEAGDIEKATEYHNRVSEIQKSKVCVNPLSFSLIVLTLHSLVIFAF